MVTSKQTSQITNNMNRLVLAMYLCDTKPVRVTSKGTTRRLALMNFEIELLMPIANCLKWYNTKNAMAVRTVV